MWEAAKAPFLRLALPSLWLCAVASAQDGQQLELVVLVVLYCTVRYCNLRSWYSCA